MKKWMKALALTTAVILLSSAASFAEEGAPAEEPAPQQEVKKEEPKKEEPKAEAPKAEEPKKEEPKAEEPKAEAPAETTAPAEPEAPAETEAPAEPEAPAETEAPAEDDTVVIEDEQTPTGVFGETGPAPFRGSVKVERKGTGAIYFGDKVTLEAKISNANTEFDIRWEVNDGHGWKPISGEHAKEYDFTITEENVDYEYRVVLVTAA